MTQKEILDYNKRCAEFLGITTGYFKDEIDCPIPEYQWMCVSANTTYQFEKEDYPDKTVYDYLKFHYDWNWIMIVVEAIEKLDNFYVQIEESACYIYDISKFTDKQCNPFISCDLRLNSKKEAVVQAINKFLIWYNENNKSYE